MLVFNICLLFVCLSYCTPLQTYNLSIYGNAYHGYYVTALLGSPPQKLNFVLDTGSSNLGVACTSNGSSNFFHFEKSESFHRNNVSVNLPYVSSHWSGFLAHELIKIGDDSVECSIACMTLIHDVFETFSQFQGILGLAYPSIALPNSSIETFLDSLIRQRGIRDIFSLDLCGPYYNSPHQQTMCGTLQIGYISSFYKPENIVYTPVTRDWYYEIMLTGFKVGNSQQSFTCYELNKDRSIVDSGTTELYLPEAIYDLTIDEIRLYTQSILPTKYWINETSACVPFNVDITKFPNITLSLFHSEDTSFDILITPNLYLLPLRSYLRNTTCFKLAIAESDKGIVIGATVLKGFYVVFDRQEKKVGFANSSHSALSDMSGIVTKPKISSFDIRPCQEENSSISPAIVILLFFIVLIAAVFLYALASWLMKHIFICFDAHSDTSSLVDDIVLETWSDEVGPLSRSAIA